MTKFFLSVPDSDSFGCPELLVSHNSAKEANDSDPEEWCVVEADTLEEARLKYEDAHEAWQDAENE